MSLTTGACFMLVSLAKDVKNDLIAFDRRIKSEPNPILLSKQLCDAISFHSKVKRCKIKNITSLQIRCHFVNFEYFLLNFFSSIRVRLIHNIAKIVQPIFASVVVANLINICVVLLSIQIDMVRYLYFLYQFQ